MPVTRRRRFVHANLAWLLATALVLALLDALTYELFFVVSLIGFLIVVELTAPFRVTPAWRRRLKWVILVGLLGFAYVVVQRIIAILPPEVL
ncbi:hypothetical protein [Halobellus ruber]|uniref:Uncharacterized protein n=1 Tax=Halobellus ruber TaxID=2761102 RepID=A0A7J9SIN9_9EURY|nr:hypothetical protein [Halobellus ruber]MBB6646598.1 hypothetical protein [Halobellus ruber]